jgi:ethanolamine utilization protein EutN
MQMGRVVGTVVSTQKHAKLNDAKLLLVQPIDVHGIDIGVPVLTIDSVGAGVGERVLVVIEGRAAGEALRRTSAPVDAAIIGIIDTITVDAAADRSLTGVSRPS